MANDECQMTKEARMTNDKELSPTVHFGIRVSSFFRHSSFVIRHFSAALKFEVWSLNFLAALLLSGPATLAADLTSSQIQFFENKIRPVLANNCYKCHSQQAEKV